MSQNVRVEELMYKTAKDSRAWGLGFKVRVWGTKDESNGKDGELNVQARVTSNDILSQTLYD